ncbi:MAG TPA: phosphatase PAP2-related protein [Patescibacteria group bacterium]
MKHRSLFSDPRFYFCLLILVIGASANFYSSALIQQLFPYRLPIQDTLFQILPYWPWTQNWSDWANIFSILLLIVYLFPKRSRLVPFVMLSFGVGYFLRSILILLNPFGGPLGNVTHYGLTTVEQHGQFPSGHIFLVTLVYFIIHRDERMLKQLALVSIFIEIAALLLSHGHYSIDIVGGLFLGYFVAHSLQPYETSLSIKSAN